MNAVNTYRLYNETKNRLETLSRRVSEGRDMVAASEFARWVFFSGIIQLCKENAVDGALKVDGALLEWTVNELVQKCNERHRTNSSAPTVTEAELKSVHEKLDTIAGYLSRLSVAPAVAVEPDLSIYDADKRHASASVTNGVELTSIAR